MFFFVGIREYCLMNNYYLIKFAQQIKPIGGDDSENLNKNWLDEKKILDQSLQDAKTSKTNYSVNNMPGGLVGKNGIAFGSPGFEPTDAQLRASRTDENTNLRRSGGVNVLGQKDVYAEDALMSQLGFTNREQLKTYLNIINQRQINTGVKTPNDISLWDKLRKDAKVPIKFGVDMVYRSNPQNDLHQSDFRYFSDINVGSPMTTQRNKLNTEVGIGLDNIGRVYTDSISYDHEANGHALALATGNNQFYQHHLQNKNFPMSTLVSNTPEDKADVLLRRKPYFSLPSEASALEGRLIRHVRRKNNKGMPYDNESKDLKKMLHNPNYQFDDNPSLQRDFNRYQKALENLDSESKEKYLDEMSKRTWILADNQGWLANKNTV